MLLVGLQRAVFLVHDLKIYKGIHSSTRVYYDKGLLCFWLQVLCMSRGR